MIVYLESSACTKLFVDEAESPALESWLGTLSPEDSVVSSILLETEMRRLSRRIDLPEDVVTAGLAGVRLTAMPRRLFHDAGALPGQHLRSLDALHVAAALLLDADVMLSYDHRLSAAATAAGLRVVAPV